MPDYQINPYIWFCEREVNFRPKHFIITNTPLTNESKKWIYEKLTGRFSVITQLYNSNNNPRLIEGYARVPAFEDPSEATFYELTWS